MKKTKLTFLGLLSSVLIFSCSKENVEVNESNNEETVQLIQEISRAFIRDQQAGFADREFRPSPEAISHDIHVGTDCLLSGLSFNDAVTFAMRASAHYGRLVPDLEEVELIGFELNPFDHFGIRHVELLHRQLTVDRDLTIDEDNTLNNENYVPYILERLEEDYGVSSDECPETTVENVEFYLEGLDDVSDYSLTNWISQRREEGLVNDQVFSILYSYFEALENAATYEDFRIYSEEAETIVIDARISESDKNIILFTMATTRHDVNYWSVNS